MFFSLIIITSSFNRELTIFIIIQIWLAFKFLFTSILCGISINLIYLNFLLCASALLLCYLSISNFLLFNYANQSLHDQLILQVLSLQLVILSLKLQSINNIISILIITLSKHNPRSYSL